MFGIALPLAGTVLVAYLLWRMAAVPTVARRLPPRALARAGRPARC